MVVNVNMLWVSSHLKGVQIVPLLDYYSLLYTLIQKKHIHTTITLHIHYRHSKYNIDYI